MDLNEIEEVSSRDCPEPTYGFFYDEIETVHNLHELGELKGMEETTGVGIYTHLFVSRTHKWRRFIDLSKEMGRYEMLVITKAIVINRLADDRIRRGSQLELPFGEHK